MIWVKFHYFSILWPPYNTKQVHRFKTQLSTIMQLPHMWSWGIWEQLFPRGFCRKVPEVLGPRPKTVILTLGHDAATVVVAAAACVIVAQWACWGRSGLGQPAWWRPLRSHPLFLSRLQHVTQNSFIYAVTEEWKCPASSHVIKIRGGKNHTA